MDEIKIESEIPIPPVRGSVRSIVHEIKAGDSVLVSQNKSKSFCSAARFLGRKTQTRVEGEMIRVWITS